MSTIEMKSILQKEINYPVNVLFVLSEMKKEAPYEYNVVQNFILSLQKQRENLCIEEINKE